MASDLSNYPPGMITTEEVEIEHRDIDAECEKCEAYRVADAVMVKGTDELISIESVCKKCGGDLKIAK